MLKYPHEVGISKKIAIRNHPELKGYKQNDLDLSEIKSRQLKHDQELECKFYHTFYFIFMLLFLSY